MKVFSDKIKISLSITGAFSNVKWIPLLRDLEALGPSEESIIYIMYYFDRRTVSLEMEGCGRTRLL